MPVGNRFDGFVHVDNGRLLDGRGEPLVLRGVGLGNWLLREGYMWKFEPGGPLASWQIEEFVVDLVGAERGAEFWRQFHDRYITEADIARIADEGFDHVRLPINARVVQDQVTGALLEDGFRLIDNTIDWCRRHNLWVVLDLHGAPGGQTGTNIDDSPNGIPELFTSASYTKLTVDLWRALATRYRDEPVVAAYDLLNEPLPNEYQHKYPAELVALYKDLTAAIREIDTVHPIVYEGSHWSTNWDIFDEVWDANSILQVHKYWSPPDKPSVQKYLDRARELNLPIYMGETGENNPDWLMTAFQLYDDCGMSWNFWPWKKIETLTSPCSVDAPAGWDAIVAYGKGTGPKPAPDDAWHTLTALLAAFAVDECTYRTDVVNALLRRAPIRFVPWAFSFRGEGESYGAADGGAVGVSLPGFRGDDRVTCECAVSNDLGEPPFQHNNGAPRSDEEAITVVLQSGDWVSYDVLVPGGDIRVCVDFSAASGEAATVAVQLGDVALSATKASGNEAANGTDCLVTATGSVAAGTHSLRLTAVGGTVRLRWLDVLPA